ncbi:MAG TPA: glycosyltransferase family 9 protein [Alphaproteobacteria bacterium]
MRILFITSTRIGDAVLSAGLLAHLVERYPDARLTIACGPAAAPLFAAVPNLDRVIPVVKHRYGLHWLRLWLTCAPRFWSLVVDLRRSAFAYTLLARRRRIVGRTRPGVHKLRQIAQTLDLMEPPAPRLWTAAAHEQAAARLIPKGGGPVVAVGPTANWRGKQWPAGNFVALIARLTGPKGPFPNARVAIFAAGDERDQALPVIESVPPNRRLDLAGAVDLPTAFACLKRCDFFVGNDSGLMHLAAAAGIPTLGLFGPSRPEHYAPWGPRAAYVRTEKSYEELVEAPGYDHRTTGTLMESLTVDAALAAAEALLARTDDRGTLVRPTLSALVVAHNEERQLAECLERLTFADELVVVLDKCTDGSREIARRFTDKIVEGSWDIEGERRNVGIDACTSDWILEVDADERVPPELAGEIRAVLPGTTGGHFLIPFDNYVGDRLVRHGWGAAWGVSSTARLFARGCKRWGMQRVHPAVELGGPRHRLKTPMIHHVDGNIGDMIRRLDRYTALRARDLRDAGLPESFGRNLRRMPTRFWKCYVRRKGYREGYYGFLIALFAALYPMLSWLRARLEDA